MRIKDFFLADENLAQSAAALSSGFSAQYTPLEQVNMFSKLVFIRGDLGAGALATKLELHDQIDVAPICVAFALSATSKPEFPNLRTAKSYSASL